MGCREITQLHAPGLASHRRPGWSGDGRSPHHRGPRRSGWARAASEITRGVGKRSPANPSQQARSGSILRPTGRRVDRGAGSCASCRGSLTRSAPAGRTGASRSRPSDPPAAGAVPRPVMSRSIMGRSWTARASPGLGCDRRRLTRPPAGAPTTEGPPARGCGHGSRTVQKDRARGGLDPIDSVAQSSATGHGAQCADRSRCLCASAADRMLGIPETVVTGEAR